jgi:hypothetical protein
MDLMVVKFSFSQVETSVLVPPLIAFCISTLTSMAGVSGAFLLLPFQISFLNFTSPAVSATNFVYNIVAIPGGVYSYLREGRMAWPLALTIIIGALPGIFMGYYLHVFYMPDPRAFKLFAGCVLLCIGLRLLYEMSPAARRVKSETKTLEEKFERQVKKLKAEGGGRVLAGIPADTSLKTISISWRKVEYEFWGQHFSFNLIGMGALSLVVGIIGGTYGIGGGAIIAPVCVAVFDLPIYTVAGAALLGTFLTSIAGVSFYSLIPAATGLQVAPDWLLGMLFGLGGFFGMYAGGRLQKYVPQKIIKLILGILVTCVAMRYIVQYWLG